MKEEDIIFSLIKKDCEESGSVLECKVLKMAQLLNINPDKYQKIRNKLVDRGKVVVDGSNFSLP